MSLRRSNWKLGSRRHVGTYLGFHCRYSQYAHNQNIWLTQLQINVGINRRNDKSYGYQLLIATSRLVLLVSKYKVQTSEVSDKLQVQTFFFSRHLEWSMIDFCGCTKLAVNRCTGIGAGAVGFSWAGRPGCFWLNCKRECMLRCHYAWHH